MKFIAHRGHSSEYRDNSMEAIQTAINLGYHGIEIDVQPCATGELCLFHDLYLGDKFIRDMSVEDVKAHGILLLEEVYDIIQDIPIYLDIKGTDSTLVKTFFKNRRHDNITFCSFNRKILKELPPTMRKGTTFEMRLDGQHEYDMITRGMQAILVHWSCLDEHLIAHCKRRGIEVLTYTHKTDEDLNYMKRFDVDGIITNGLRTHDNSDPLHEETTKEDSTHD